MGTYRFLIEKFDYVFNNRKCFNTYLAFEHLKQEFNESIEEYLSAFDSKLYKLKEVNVELDDAILACSLLKKYNQNDIHFQLALSTTPEMIFDNMR